MAHVDSLYSPITLLEDIYIPTNIYIPTTTPYWRTMDTLPEDGINVLLYFPEFAEPQIGHCAHYTKLGWYGSWDGVVGLLAKTPKPTYWMPLPNPPEPFRETGDLSSTGLETNGF